MHRLTIVALAGLLGCDRRHTATSELLQITHTLGDQTSACSQISASSDISSDDEPRVIRVNVGIDNAFYEGIASDDVLVSVEDELGDAIIQVGLAEGEEVDDSADISDAPPLHHTFQVITEGRPMGEDPLTVTVPFRATVVGIADLAISLTSGECD